MPHTDAAVQAQPLEWTEEFRIGIDVIDDDHKKLIALSNALTQALSDDGQGKVVHAVVKELLDYTVYHFGREEVVMRRYRYPGFLAHKQMHDEFVREVATARDRLAHTSGHEAVTLPLAHFLQDWLVNHILKVDKQVGQHIAAQDRAAAG